MLNGHLAGFGTINAGIVDEKATQAESPTVPELSVWRQLAARRGSISLCDYFPEDAARIRPLRWRTLPGALSFGLSAGVAYGSKGCAIVDIIGNYYPFIFNGLFAWNASRTIRLAGSFTPITLPR
jgi:hypothetical protein